MKRIYFLILIFSVFLGCKKTVYKFKRPSKGQSFTVKNEGDIRYIFNGNRSFTSDTNYIKLDLSDVAFSQDNLAGCWKKEGVGWELFIDNAIILENKLDTSKFNFKTQIPIDNYNIPDFSVFNKSNCFLFNFALDDTPYKTNNLFVK